MLFPLRVPPTPLPHAFSHIQMQREQTTPRASPLVTHSCSQHPPRRLLRSTEWPKVGEPLLAAHAINSKASRFYWMDLARPPHPPHRTILITTPGVEGTKARAGCRSIDRVPAVFLFIHNFRFSLMMLPLSAVSCFHAAEQARWLNERVTFI